jgi:DNA-binding winged helix-turn-helix (wHTH) protein
LNPARVRFDAFDLDESNALLLRNGKAVTLAPKPFAVLCALARRPGSLLTKHALLDDVWGHQFVTDSVLKTAVSEVRTVLDDHPRQPRFIETVSRRGYRFIAPTSAISTTALVRAIDFSGPPSFENCSETLPLPRAARDIALSRKRDVECAVSNVDVPRRELGCTSPQPVCATADEVRYAHELRLQLRVRLLRDAAPHTWPWCVSAD